MEPEFYAFVAAHGGAIVIAAVGLCFPLYFFLRWLFDEEPGDFRAIGLTCFFLLAVVGGVGACCYSHAQIESVRQAG